MLQELFGNKSAKWIFLHIFHYGSSHARAIAQDTGMSETAILRQLSQLENAGILISKQVGKARVYQFNEKNPYIRPVREIVKMSYESIPLEVRQEIFRERRRPRRKGKPVL